MKEREPRRIILTQWNAGVFKKSSLPRLLPELVIYSLLYDDVLIREEDLITNRHITRHLTNEENFRIFEELLNNGLVKLLRLPSTAYPPERRFDPALLPISARAEEHQLRRTYKGRSWKPTAWEWKLFHRLDRIVDQSSDASRFHVPFPLDNPFANELAHLLEKREDYIKNHPVFRYVDPKTSDYFIKFCREPEAWQRFLRDSGAKEIIIGPDGGFYRSAAYQCLYLLPSPRTMQRLVESVYAATYCDREVSDGRYGSGSELIELPFRYELEEERQAADQSIANIDVVPTDAVADIAIGPGIAPVLTRTRESQAFDELQRSIDQLGRAPRESLLPSDAAFRYAWRNLTEVYTEHFTKHFVTQTAVDHKITKWTVILYLVARSLVNGFKIVPEDSLFKMAEPIVDASAIASFEIYGPPLLRALRAQIKIPAIHQSLMSSIRVRCSKVALNTR